MRTTKEHTAKRAQIARTAFSLDRASNEELLARGIAVYSGGPVLPGRLVEIGAETGLVYAIQSVIHGSPVKVGYSNAAGMEGRVASLQTGNPYRLRVLATAGAYMSHEQRAHKVLAPDRLTGEWFGWSPRVAAFVAALRSQGIEYAIAAAKLAKNRP